MAGLSKSKVGLQTMPGCCCGCLEGHTKCCRCDCTCRRLCVTFSPSDELDSNYEPCQVISEELHWNGSEEAFVGSVAGIDVRYYFEQDGDDCYFKLRSGTLGFPEGYEAAWQVGGEYGDVDCSSLATAVSVPATPEVDCSAGTLTTSCAIKIAPVSCTGCDCACECLCVTYSKGDIIVGGKACWDGYGQWQGALKISEYETKDITISMFPKNLLCEPYDPYCDDEDTTCTFVVTFGHDPVENYVAANCPDVSGVLRIANPYDVDEIITFRCAECTEDCEIKYDGCCEDTLLPETLYCTIEIEIQLKKDNGGPVPDNFGAPFECATYTVPVYKVYGSHASYENLVGIPMPDCFGPDLSQTAHGYILLICTSSMDIIWQMSAGPYVWVNRINSLTLSCAPFFCQTTIGYSQGVFFAGSVGGQTGDPLSQYIAVQSACCGLPYHLSNSSLFYGTRIKLTVTS